MNSTEPTRESVKRFLTESGLLPKPAGTLDHRVIQSSIDNWIPVILGQWQREAVAECTEGDRRARKMVAWLEGQMRGGAQLRDTWSNPNLVRWIGPRFQWWARRVTGSRHVAILSSRLGRKLERRDTWFNHLRAACGQIELDQEALLCVARTTTAPYAARCGEIFGCQVVNVALASSRASLDRWWRKPTGMLAASEPVGDGPGILPDVCISPEVVRQDEQSDALEPSNGLPLGDRVLAGLADRLIAILVRPGGNIHQLIRRGLQEKAWPTAAVRIALGHGLVEPSVADELMSLGAIGWNVQDCCSHSLPNTVSDLNEAPSPRGKASPIRRLVQSESWSNLSHCTRRRHGPWPDQSHGEFLDDLILARDGRNHSELATLRRILGTGRLHASNLGIRGGTAVVSFTDVPLWQINHLRHYRSHRGRWDFLPYGICIDLRWLEQHGARPVCYGDETTWNELAETDRPFFQLSHSRTGPMQSSIDWTVEREWRHIGDVDLREIPSDRLSVFVPSLAEARELAGASRWPILVIDDI